MPDLNDIATFVRVVEARSFSAAARRAGVSKSSVSKGVARLERALGARLLNRSTRGLSPTEAGTLFHRHASRMMQEAALAAQAVESHHSTPQGLLRIAAPAGFASACLARALPAFFRRFPALRTELALHEAAPDLIEGRYDVVLARAAAFPGHLVAHRVARLPRLLCAAPGYLLSHGLPETPRDLAGHDCLHAAPLWEVGDAAVRVRGSVRADDERVLRQAAIGGLGIALLPAYLVEQDVRRQSLVPVLRAYPPAPEVLYALRMPGAHVAAKVRALIDFLRERFGEAVARPGEEGSGQRPGRPDYIGADSRAVPA